jgi:hypothetical protein
VSELESTFPYSIPSTALLPLLATYVYTIFFLESTATESPLLLLTELEPLPAAKF